MAKVSDSISREERVRIGPISVFALIIVLCLAVLSVLAFSTANAANTMSQRQAASVTGIYENETAAQEFIANVDDELAQRGASGLKNSLSSIAAEAEDAAGGAVDVSAIIEGGVVNAEFTNESGRVLSIRLTIRNNNTYRIDSWKVTAVQNEEQPHGNLLAVNS